MVLRWDQRFLGNEEELNETRRSCEQDSKGWPALKALIPVIIFKLIQKRGHDGVSRQALAYLDQKRSAVAALHTAKKDFGLHGSQYQSSIRGFGC